MLGFASKPAAPVTAALELVTKHLLLLPLPQDIQKIKAFLRDSSKGIFNFNSCILLNNAAHYVVSQESQQNTCLASSCFTHQSDHGSCSVSSAHLFQKDFHFFCHPLPFFPLMPMTVILKGLIPVQLPGPSSFTARGNIFGEPTTPILSLLLTSSPHHFTKVRSCDAPGRCNCHQLSSRGPCLPHVLKKRRKPFKSIDLEANTSENASSC